MELTSYASSDRLDATFAALADPTRRAILARLATGEASVNELATPFNMTQPAISKHLRVLERAGLISTSREAQRRPRRLEAAPLAQATEWLENYRKFWEERFQHLDALLVDLQKDPGENYRDDGRCEDSGSAKRQHALEATSAAEIDFAEAGCDQTSAAR
jgi:DNA-binding transcriptional ArsR family regulator